MEKSEVKSKRGFPFVEAPTNRGSQIDTTLVFIDNDTDLNVRNYCGDIRNPDPTSSNQIWQTRKIFTLSTLKPLTRIPDQLSNDSYQWCDIEEAQKLWKNLR